MKPDPKSDDAFWDEVMERRGDEDPAQGCGTDLDDGFYDPYETE